MQWLQTETPRIENQVNQPLSISVIFSPLYFHQLPFFFPPSTLAVGFEMGKMGGGSKCGQDLYSREESSSLALLPGIGCRIIC